MGQREEYLKSDSNWHASLSREERIQRWPSSAFFGLALSGKAARAIAASNKAVAVAEAAQTMVHYQAVYALLEEGQSVREIAEQLQLSKSKVGRYVRTLTKKDGTFQQPVGRVSMGASCNSTRDLVLSAWDIDDDTITKDHPRGTHEPSPTHITDFGGTNRN